MAGQNLTTLARYLVAQPAATPSASQKAQLQQLITAASRAIINELNIDSLVNSSYTERYDGLGNTRLLLRKYPVTSITALYIGSQLVPPAIPPGPNAPCPSGYLIQSWDGIPPGQLQTVDVFNYFFCSGMQNITVTYNAGYAIIGEAATLTTTSYTANQPYGFWAADNGVTYASSGVALVPVSSNPTVGQYVPPNPYDPTSPTYSYTFNTSDENKPLLFNYSYMPTDLEQACIAWVAERVAYAQRVGMKSQSLAAQETFSYFLGAMPDYVMNILDSYRIVVPF